jgi:hypothetical protein
MMAGAGAGRWAVASMLEWPMMGRWLVAGNWLSCPSWWKLKELFSLKGHCLCALARAR